MFLRDLRSSLLRRWYLVVAGLLLTVGAAALTATVVPATYQATASVVLLPPSTAVTSVGNPYMVLGGLSQAVDVLTHRAVADEAQGPILAAHLGTSYTVERDITTSGPIIIVTAAGKTPAATVDSLKAVMTMVPAQLRELQDQLGVNARARITMMTLSQTEKPTTVAKARTRALLAVVAAGLIATVMVAGLLDGLLLRRRLRGVHRAAGLSAGVGSTATPAAGAEPTGGPRPAPSRLRLKPPGGRRGTVNGADTASATTADPDFVRSPR